MRRGAGGSVAGGGVGAEEPYAAHGTVGGREERLGAYTGLLGSMAGAEQETPDPLFASRGNEAAHNFPRGAQLPPAAGQATPALGPRLGPHGRERNGAQLPGVADEPGQVNPALPLPAGPRGDASKRPRPEDAAGGQGVGDREASEGSSERWLRRPQEGLGGGRADGGEGGHREELTEDQLRKLIEDATGGADGGPAEPLKKMLRELLDKKKSQREKFRGLKKPKSSGLGMGKVACPACGGVIDGACHKCPECEADLKGPKMEARKRLLDEMLQEGEAAGKYYNPAKVMRSLKEKVEELSALSGSRVHVALFWAYKTKTGKQTIDAFGVGRTGMHFVKDKAILPVWRDLASGFMRSEVARHQGRRAAPPGGPQAADTWVDFAHISMEAVLQELQLPQYIRKFAEGNVTMESVKECALSDMVDFLGMLPGHALKLNSKIQALRKGPAGLTG